MNPKVAYNHGVKTVYSRHWAGYEPNQKGDTVSIEFSPYGTEQKMASTIRCTERTSSNVYSLWSDGGKHWEKTDSAYLVDFHSREKLFIMAHSQKHYREIRRLVASGKGFSSKGLYHRYEAFLLNALDLKATVSKNMNVLMHILGYLKKQLSADEKRELLELITKYRNVHMPLIVPVILINHFVRKYSQPYLSMQTYLNPHPVELQLRNHS